MTIVEIIRPVDPVAKAIKYLQPLFPDAKVTLFPPPDWEWNKPLITVTDVGGMGMHDYVMDNVFLHFMVSMEDSSEASEVARTLLGLLRAWAFLPHGVYWKQVIQRPTFTPDEESEVPAYTLTVSLDFRAETVQV